jgi:hypothetical protein
MPSSRSLSGSVGRGFWKKSEVRRRSSGLLAVWAEEGQRLEASKPRLHSRLTGRVGTDSVHELSIVVAVAVVVVVAILLMKNEQNMTS